MCRRAEAEEALRESEARTRAITDSARDAILMMDTAGRVSYWNPAAERILGYTREEAIGQSLHTFIVPQRFLAAHAAAYPAFLATGQGAAVGRTLDLMARRKDGQEIDVQLSLSSVLLGDGWHAVGLLRDISEQKQTAEALRLSEEQLRAMFELASIGMAQADPCTRQWLRVNQKLCAITGYSADEMLRMRVSEMTHPEDRQMDDEAFQRVVRGEEPDYRLEKRYIRKDGTSTWVSVNMTVIRDGTGQASRTLATIEDITQRKRDETELHKLDKLQSVGTLAGGIAHDFNNILLGLFGNLSLALEDLPQEHPSRAPLAEAEKAMGRAVRLTKQLLTFAKGGDPVKENVSLGAMVEEIARFDLSGSNVSLICHQGKDLWPVDADKGQIQQVISNLVINARQAMPAGGHLTIALKNVDLPAKAIATLRPGHYVKVIVQDEGNGINPKVLNQIFTPYFTTKQSNSGLGLATVWSIINKHGGHIGVASELGKGATFTFYLPASAAPTTAEAKPPAAACTPLASPAKILVMDDDAMVCDLASKMLTRCGYTVATAPGGKEATALYRQALEAGAPFDLVIMDLTIPGGIGGKEAVKELLALDPHVRAIVSSGYADDPVMANPSKYGFKGTVAKPYTARALREAVASALE
jgi:PAS domain S-box-containing protein